jgi:hypothetical protein
VRRTIVLTVLAAAGFTFAVSPLRAEGLQASTKKFVYQDASGRVTSVKVIHHYWTKPIVHPFAKIDPRLDPKLSRAATLAQETASAESKAHCWHKRENSVSRRGRDQFISKNRLRSRSRRRINAQLWIQTIANPRSVRRSDRRGPGLRRQKSRPRRDPNENRFRQRLSQQVSLLLSAHRRLRKIRVLKARSGLRAGELRELFARLSFAWAMEFAFPILGKLR